jgi:hypothetical protein
MLVHPELTKLFLIGCRSYYDLEADDKLRFRLLLRNIFSSIQGGFVRQTSVNHDPEGLRGLERVVDEIVSNKGVREFLESIEPDWRPEFKTFVNTRLSKIAEE